MMNSVFSRVATAALLCMGALAGFAPAANAATETVIYSFQNNRVDGYYPASALVGAAGTLYGTTLYGGTGGCISGCGTIFSVSHATGAETVLYSFHGKTEQGSQPGSLLAQGGQLFGTTSLGGHRDEGSLFSLGLGTGAFKTLYSFCALQNCGDGAGPSQGLLAWKGGLYGTTFIGGPNDTGVVFALDLKSGNERSIYSFHNGADGNSAKIPWAVLFA